MFRRIEIIGYAGSGKSTICKYIKRDCIRKGRLKTDVTQGKIFLHDDARRFCALNLIKDREANFLRRLIYNFIFRFHFIDKLLAFSKRVVYQKYDLIYEIDHSEKEIIVLDKLLGDLHKKLPFTRFLDVSYKFRARTIDLYLFKKYLIHDCVIIQDEFFLQSSSFGPEEMLYYANNMPMLGGIVILTPKADVINERIIRRKKIHFLHRNYRKNEDSYEELKNSILPDYEKKLNRVRESSVNVLEMDIELSPKENAEKIQIFARDILKSHTSMNESLLT